MAYILLIIKNFDKNIILIKLEMEMLEAKDVCVCIYTCSMLPSSISVLNVSNMDSWSRFSKSSTHIGAVIINTNKA
jgi:pseudouridine-5'-phosphate glycosidase